MSWRSALTGLYDVALQAVVYTAIYFAHVWAKDNVGQCEDS